MLGLNPTEQETVDIPNQIARQGFSCSYIFIHLYLYFEFIVRNGLIYFPDFCQLCLEKFRESEEEQEEFFSIAFKVLTNN